MANTKKKNKNIINTRTKNIPKSIKNKVKQKIKNIGNNTPTQNVKKGLKTAYEYFPSSLTGGKISRAYNRKAKAAASAVHSKVKKTVYDPLKKKVSSLKKTVKKKVRTLKNRVKRTVKK